MNRYIVANCYRLFCQGRLPEQAPGNPNPWLQTNSNRQFRKVRDCEPRSPGRRGDRSTILNQKTEATGQQKIPAFLLSLLICPQAAGNRTTFFLPRLKMFVGGTRVTSTYFLAQAARSRLQLR